MMLVLVTSLSGFERMLLPLIACKIGSALLSLAGWTLSTHTCSQTGMIEYSSRVRMRGVGSMERHSEF